ncbi:hypothetical protein M011DRAFT_469052 [Sporormia fimetaria CBS 119925]|uniref:Bromo domain-containing protein n=1 Tax=Sporormia fimetaria CBS 119925 TaxID=1340428 RepID=A0A6A6V5E4_9PLEO|nr:hypothetical protein M011DRAFT_469052 [Sporormia fimetaria CBS 119925]
MNTALSPYTHLESLLLFHCLHVFGLANSAFSRISDLLKNNPSITSDKRYQTGRLSPDALRNFSLRVLKEEDRSEGVLDGNGDSPAPEGRISRKRKAPSPTFATVQEAAQHAHLIPKLVSKLYLRYRTALTHEIRDDEDRYERLVNELQSLERREPTAELAEQAKYTSPVPNTPSPLPTQSLQSHMPHPTNLSPQPVYQHAKPSMNSPAIVHGQAHPQYPHHEPPRITPSRNGQLPPEPQMTAPPVPDMRQDSGPFAPYPQPPYAHPPPRHLQLAQTPQPQPQPAPPRLPQLQSASFSGSQQYPRPSPYAPHHQTVAGQGVSPISPAPGQGHYVSPSPQPASPAPHAAHLSPQPQLAPRGNGVPPTGPMTGQPPFPSPQQQAYPNPPPPQPPHAHTPQTQRQPPYSGPPMYSPLPPPAAHPPPQGGFVPPFQAIPHDPSRGAHPGMSPYPQVSTPLSRPPVSHAPVSQTDPRTAPFPPAAPSHIRGGHLTPVSVRASFSVNSTPRSARTLWKSRVSGFTAPETPRPEVSPINDLASPELPKSTASKTRSTRKGKAKGNEKEKGSPETEAPADAEIADAPVMEMETRQGRSRRMGASKRGRPPSLASSRAGGSVRERSRSQSVVSHADTVPAEDDSHASTRVKTERATPSESLTEDAPTPTHHATRRRGATSRGRKRNAREASLPESEDNPTESPAPNQRMVVAPRHFSRMSNPIMNDISSHKRASTFNTAVKAKHADGYYDIIKRPTDLKSIQKAIAAGAKIVAAAASATDNGTPSGSSPGNGGGIIELPLSEDVIPPKAIVNSAQLENELMRMFCNAVMFNPGEEGVVADAREMFREVENAVSNWRGAERSSGLAGGAGEEVVVVGRTASEEKVERDDGPLGGSKRRKVGGGG